MQIALQSFGPTAASASGRHPSDPRKGSGPFVVFRSAQPFSSGPVSGPGLPLSTGASGQTPRCPCVRGACLWCAPAAGVGEGSWSFKSGGRFGHFRVARRCIVPQSENTWVCCWGEGLGVVLGLPVYLLSSNQQNKKAPPLGPRPCPFEEGPPWVLVTWKALGQPGSKNDSAPPTPPQALQLRQRRSGCPR